MKADEGKRSADPRCSLRKYGNRIAVEWTEGSETVKGLALTPRTTFTQITHYWPQAPWAEDGSTTRRLNAPITFAAEGFAGADAVNYHSCSLLAPAGHERSAVPLSLLST
jgi:hypothetical protein